MSASRLATAVAALGLLACTEAGTDAPAGATLELVRATELKAKLASYGARGLLLNFWATW